MEQTLQALAGLLIKAVPTVLILILLHFYLKYMFFRPLERILQTRFEASEGARKAAEASLADASRKAAEYEEAIRAARATLYREQEEHRRKLKAEQDAAVQDARRAHNEFLQKAQREIAAELENAKRSIQPESDAMADLVVKSILRGRAA